MEQQRKENMLVPEKAMDDNEYFCLSLFNPAIHCTEDKSRVAAGP